MAKHYLEDDRGFQHPRDWRPKLAERTDQGTDGCVRHGVRPDRLEPAFGLRRGKTVRLRVSRRFGWSCLQAVPGFGRIRTSLSPRLRSPGCGEAARQPYGEPCQDANEKADRDAGDQRGPLLDQDVSGAGHDMPNGDDEFPHGERKLLESRADRTQCVRQRSHG